MSDLANDGSGLPGPPAPAPPAQPEVDTSDYRSQNVIVTVLTITFALIVVLELTMGILEQLFVAGRGMSDRAEAGDPLAVVLALLFGMAGVGYVLLFILTVILYCVWLHRANRNAGALGAEGMIFTPGWSVGWFFIPFANLWKPYQAVSEIYRAAEPGARGYDWVDVPVPAVVKLWWGCWIVTGILGNIELRLQNKAEEIGAMISLVNLPIGIAAAVLAIVVIRMIHSRLEERARSLRSGSGDPAQAGPSFS